MNCVRDSSSIKFALQYNHYTEKYISTFNIIIENN